MPLRTLVESGTGTGITASVVSGKKDYPRGLVTYVEPIRKYEPGNIVFSNLVDGSSMNVDGSTLGSSAETIHDGGDTSAWTASTLSGTWNFSSDISVTSANNNDAALFTKADPPLVLSSYVTMTGAVTLWTYSGVQNTILLQYRLAGANLGNQLELDTYIDTGIINLSQSFQISLADFGLEGQTVDELVITMTRNGGVQPTVDFDDLKIEDTGAKVYEVVAKQGNAFKFKDLSIVVVTSAPTGVDSSGSLYPTTPNIDYSTFMGTTLLNGINIRWTRKQEVRFSGTFRKLSDFFLFGFHLETLIDNGTYTCIRLRIPFYDEGNDGVLDSRTGDKMEITIADNLSLFTEVRAMLRGVNERVDEIIKS